LPDAVKRQPVYIGLRWQSIQHRQGKIRPEYLELYQLTLQEAWNDQSNHLQDDKRQISNQITDLEGRLTYLRDLLSTQKIQPEDYRKMKAECTDKIEKLLRKLANSSQTPVDFGGLLSTGMQNLMNLERLYKKTVTL
jgi:site-specific DNA recombinase